MTENTTPAEKPAKVVKTQHPCKCGVPTAAGNACSGVTFATFAPGHDQKAVGYLTRQVVKEGKLTTEQAVEQLRKVGASDVLVGKLTAAIARETKASKAKEAAKEQAAAARVEKAAAREAAKANKPEVKPKDEAKTEFARAQAAKVKEDLAAKAQTTSQSAEAKANA